MLETVFLNSGGTYRIFDTFVVFKKTYLYNRLILYNKIK